MSLFSLEYPVTRPFTLGWVVHTAFILGAIWLTLITLLNVVAVAYETVPFTSTSFNDTTGQLWYEKFLPTFWLPPSRSCSGSVIPLNAGCPFIIPASHRLGLQTVRHNRRLDVVDI